jgi:hypothetical protein
MRTTVLIVTAALAATSPVLAQAAGTGRPGRREFLPRDREIALARSAAPPAVSDSASVYVLGARGWELAVRGSNGVACHVNRSWPDALEPHCFDAEGAETIMRMEMRRTELYHQGVGTEEAGREIAAMLADGRLRLPRRPAMSYMMSAGQRLVGDDGRAVGAWRPHLMIYFPYLTAADLGLGDNQDPRSAILVDPGKPTSNIMVIVRDFVAPAGEAARSP